MARLYDNFAELKRRIQSDPSKSGFQHAIEMATSSKEEVDPSDPKSLAELGFGFELMFIPEACGWCYPPEAEQDRRHKILNEHRSWRS